MVNKKIVLELFGDTLMVDISEGQINIKMRGGYSVNWFMYLSAASSAGLSVKI
jgi:hypothetical protein